MLGGQAPGLSLSTVLGSREPWNWEPLSVLREGLSGLGSSWEPLVLCKLQSQGHPGVRRECVESAVSAQAAPKVTLCGILLSPTPSPQWVNEETALRTPASQPPPHPSSPHPSHLLPAACADQTESQWVLTRRQRAVLGCSTGPGPGELLGRGWGWGVGVALGSSAGRSPGKWEGKDPRGPRDEGSYEASYEARPVKTEWDQPGGLGTYLEAKTARDLPVALQKCSWGKEGVVVRTGRFYF